MLRPVKVLHAASSESQGSYASGKFKFFQGQGIVKEFYIVSVKNGYLLKCQGNVRELYNFQFVSNDEKQKIAKAVF